MSRYSELQSARLSAFLTARGAPPPLALARRLRASLGPQALSLVPCPLSLFPLETCHPDTEGFLPRSGRRNVLQIGVRASMCQIHGICNARHRLEADKIPSGRRIDLRWTL